MKIFLGGTCNESTWRSELIPHLEANKINFFNPVVEDWTPDCQLEEYRQKDEECDVHLYVITKEMVGVFSIAEAMDSAHRQGVICLFQIIKEGFTESQYKSLLAVAEMVVKIGGYSYSGNDFDWIIKYLTIAQSAKNSGKLRHIEKALNAMNESPVKKYIKLENVEDIKGVAPKVIFELQSDPIGEVGVNGCQASDMLEFVKCLFQSLNSAVPNRETAITITKIQEALMWQDERTKDRSKRGVEGSMSK